MAILTQNLDVREHSDRKTLIESLRSAGMILDEAAIQNAVEKLTDDWFELKVLDVCSLKAGPKHSEAFAVASWARVIQSLYEFRNHKNIETQIHRLRVHSHEKLDTVLVLLVAGRYHRRGFSVSFEPFGEGSTDLLIARDLCRLYAEIKRENPQVHRRVNRIREIGATISRMVTEKLQEWLQDRGVRVEIKLSKLFADSHVPQVVDEICTRAGSIDVGQEAKVDSAGNSTMIVLPRDAEFHYRKGAHMAVISVPADKPIQISAPSSTPVRCTFDLQSNLKALGERIRDAGKQLNRDLNRDEEAFGFVVLESAFGREDEVEAIQKRFWPRLPTRCWGVTLIAPQSWVIPRPDLAPEHAEILKYAALDLLPQS